MMMKISKVVFGAIAAIALSGCAVSYTFDGKKYDSKESFHQAVDSNIVNVLSEITPLKAPVSNKKLIFAIPSEDVFTKEAYNRFVKIQGNQPTGAAKEILDNIPKANYKNAKVFFDAVRKKNIYASTQFIDMPAMTGAFEASVDTDTVYYIEPTQGSGQWFYHSSKGGKQIFSYDRSSPTPSGKVQAFIDAVLTQAIRD
jgi:hypothetical protein